MPLSQFLRTKKDKLQPSEKGPKGYISHAQLLVLFLLPLLATAAKAQEKDSLDKTPKPLLKVGTRLYGQYVIEPNAENTPNNRFELYKARISLDVAPTPWLSGQFDADLANAPAFKDVYINLKLIRWLKFKVGLFKKPFSGIELWSPKKLQVFWRGMINRRISDDLDYAGRDIGLMMHGKLPWKLSYKLGVFNGNGKLAEIDSGKDLAARLTWAPVKALTIAGNGSLKYRNPQGVDLTQKAIWAAGLDSEIRFWRLDLYLELLWAQNRQSQIASDHLGGILMATLKFKPFKKITLWPVLKAEFLDEDPTRTKNEALAVTAGLTARFSKILRLMLQGEIIEPRSESTIQRQKLIVLMLAFDYKQALGADFWRGDSPPAEGMPQNAPNEAIPPPTHISDVP